MVGNIILWIALGAGLTAAVSYYQAATQQKSTMRLARNSFGAMVVAVVVVSALLFLYVLRHQFEYAYVWGYSSRSLPLHLLITTFWAGQEGSFLFWALCGSIIGPFVMSYSRRKQIECEVMTVYALVQSFLLVLLIVKSPFQMIWDAHPEQFAVGAVPADGRGLNPLLQSFWMVIHPPVLFLGFAAMAVPFVFAFAALWRRQYGEWIGYSVPWVIFGTIALGAGIILGGYWAYGVLGWGGWWGWDPVENSSLIPWMVGVILIHTMLVQKRTGGLVRTNFILAISTYVLVVYSTFLTRSGILGDSSVHSFVDPGTLTYTLLVVWIVTAIAFGFGMIARRWKAMQTSVQPSSFWTRESLLAISSAVMGASALVILLGTSWPILSRASLEPTFYDKTNLPIVIALGLLLGASLLVQWTSGSLRELVRSSFNSIAASAAALAVLVWLGVHDFWMAAFAFTSLFAFFVNVVRLYRLAKESVLYTGGALSHIGLALLFLGIIGSGRYGHKETATLTLLEPREVLGYTLTYTGSQATSDGKWKFPVRVEKNGSQFTLQPVMYQSDYNNSVMRNPDYASFLMKDFYIEPVSLEQIAATGGGGQARNVIRLRKGESRVVDDMQVTFLRFDMDHQAIESMTGSGGFAVGAVLEVKKGRATELVIPVTVYQERQSPQTRVARTEDGSRGFELLAMNVGASATESAIDLNVTGAQEPIVASAQKEALVIEASVKPFISLVWAAAALVTTGLLISLRSKWNNRRGRGARSSMSAAAEKENRGLPRRSNGERVEELAEGT